MPTKSASFTPPVREALKSLGYHSSCNDAKTDFRFRIATQYDQRFDSRILVWSKERVIQFIVQVSRPYVIEKKSWVSELVQRTDERIGLLGGFSFDCDTGTAFFRMGQRFERQPGVRAILKMMNTAAWPIEIFATAFDHVTDPTVSPEGALDFALLIHGVVEDLAKPARALKALLKVENGGGKASNPVNGSKPTIFTLI